MRRTLLPLALSALLPLQALAGTPLENALAAPQEGPLYIFDVIVANDDIDAVLRVDPTQPEGLRVTVVSPPKEDWNDALTALLKERQADADGDIWCHGLAESIPADARLVSETDTTATYTFRPQAGAEKSDMDDMLEYLNGTVVVAKDNPAILAVEMVAEKPFKPLPIAKVKKFEVKFACERAPDGRTHIARVNVDISGSALMRSFSESEQQTFTNLRAVPESGMGTK